MIVFPGTAMHEAQTEPWKGWLIVLNFCVQRSGMFSQVMPLDEAQTEAWNGWLVVLDLCLQRSGTFSRG